MGADRMHRITHKRAAASAIALALGTALGTGWADTRPVPIGESISGDACELRARDDLSPLPGLPVDQRIVCNGRPVGNVNYAKFLQPGNRESDVLRTQILNQFKASRPGLQLKSRMSCSDAVWMDAKTESPIALLPCQLNSGGWQHMVMVHANRDVLVVAEAPPALAANLLQNAGAQAEQAAAITTRAALQKYWGKPVVLASAADLDAFRQLIRDGRTANSTFRYNIAEDAFRRALELQGKFLGPDDVAIADTLLDLALNVSNQGKPDEAQALFRRAEAIIQKSPFDADRARLSYYQGQEAANRGDFENALRYARDASSAWRKLAAGPSLTGMLGAGADNTTNLAEKGELALALNFEARMALRNEDIVSANAAASEALLLLNQLDTLPKWWRADTMMTLGEISVGQGRLSAAETYFNSALAIRRQTFGDGPGTIGVLTALGRAYQQEGLNTSAIITFRDAFKIAKNQNISAEAFTREQVIPFGAAIADYAATLTDENAKQGLFAEAFDAFHLVRSGVVEKTIAKAQARLASDDPNITALIEKLQTTQREHDSARAELASEQSLPDEERSGDVEKRLITSIRGKIAEIRALQARLKTEFPAYSQLASPTPLTLLELRKQLGDREALVSFLIGRRQSFIQLTRRDGNYVARIPEGEAALADTVKALRRALEIQGGSVNEFNLSRANDLYKSLFGQLEPQLKGIDHLIVAPAGPLSSLPFSLLVTQNPQSGEYNDAQWLTQRLAISHVPSIHAFYSLRNTQPKRVPPKAMLAFGDPVLTGQSPKAGESSPLEKAMNECRPNGPMNGDTLRAMLPLPETATEVKTVSDILGANKSTVFLRDKATEPTLRAQNLQDYRILYFATHGLLPGELKCQAEPGLVLTPPSQRASDKASDGLLEASEIASLKMSADMVVLSACNTAGGGGKFGGEALSGLAESFFFAGARSLVVSHWQVPSAATAQLLSGMFGKLGPDLKGGSSPALRAAQQTMIKDKKTAHPFFWAAFVVVGDGMAASSASLLAANTVQEVKR
jgi:CHAT domain-containing protein